MSSVSKEDMEQLRQEMLYDNKITELESQVHEDDMRTNINYFCEWCLDNLVKSNTTSLRDMVELLNGEVRKYDQDIDSVYDYLKEI